MAVLNGIDSQGEQLLIKFKRWLKLNRIWYDEEKIEIKVNCTRELKNNSRNGIKNDQTPTSGHDFGVLAKQDIDEDEIICTIPKESILSHRTCGIANVFEDEEMFDKTALVIALMYELSIQERSPWYDYFNIMQKFESVPTLWEQSDLVKLNGTQIGSIVNEYKTGLTENYNTIILPLVQKYPAIFDKSFFTLSSYLNAITLVNSRAFAVDEYHGEAMVPLADLFNHKSRAENIHLESDSVCEECGAIEDCVHSVEEEGLDEEEIEGEECSKSNNSDTDSVVELIDEEETEPSGIKSELNEEECYELDKDYDKDNQIQLRVVLKCKKDKEIFNTYGILNNSELLERYGFADLDNPDEDIIFNTKYVIEEFLSKDEINDSELLNKVEFFNRLAQAFYEEEGEDEIEGEEEEEEGNDHDDGGEGEESDNEDEQEIDESEIEGEIVDDEEEEEEEEEEEMLNLADLRILSEGQISFNFFNLLYVLHLPEAKIAQLMTKFDKEEGINELKEFMSEKYEQWSDLLSVEQKNKKHKTSHHKKANEIYVKIGNVLRRLINHRLSLFSPITSIEMDRKELLNVKSRNHRFALICRISEKNLLLKALVTLPL